MLFEEGESVFGRFFFLKLTFNTVLSLVIVKKRCNSSNIQSFRFCSALNPDGAIRMN